MTVAQIDCDPDLEDYPSFPGLCPSEVATSKACLGIGGVIRTLSLSVLYIYIYIRVDVHKCIYIYVYVCI